MYLTKENLHLLTAQAGIYLFLDKDEHVLYVGKAKNLSKRVKSYFRPTGLNTKTLAMVQHIAYIKTVCTNSEHAALVLENQLIKKHKPKYNICLKDDKTYPFIYLTKDKFPKIGTSRGRKRKNVEYFGPYTNVGRVRQTLDVAQKIFRVRTCRDANFVNRSRACLLYQIGRCTGPCVGHVNEQDYSAQVQDLRSFLKGNHTELIESFIEKMQAASIELNYEKAAKYRDCIANIQNLAQQEAHNPQHKSLDIIIAVEELERVHFQITWIRESKIVDSKDFCFKDAIGTLHEKSLSFLQQYYTQELVPYDCPIKILCPSLDKEISLGVSENCVLPVHDKAKSTSEKSWADVAKANAIAFIQHAQLESQKYALAFSNLAEIFGEEQWERIECIDISHTQGHQTYSSCVVFTPQGKETQAYRVYKLSTQNDDYQSMRETITRRFKKNQTPDLLLIDGGKGQLHAVQKTLYEIGLPSVSLLAITKDSTRKNGLEHYYTWTEEGLDQEVFPNDHAKRVLENIRDEAHRFAITHHRKARAKVALQDSLIDIDGIGEKKHALLLKHFGGVKQLQKATLNQIMHVPGFSHKLAKQVYENIRTKSA